MMIVGEEDGFADVSDMVMKEEQKDEWFKWLEPKKIGAMKARAMKTRRNKDCAMKALVTERKGLDRQALILCWKKGTGIPC